MARNHDVGTSGNRLQTQHTLLPARNVEVVHGGTSRARCCNLRVVPDVPIRSRIERLGDRNVAADAAFRPGQYSKEKGT